MIYFFLYILITDLNEFSIIIKIEYFIISRFVTNNLLILSNKKSYRINRSLIFLHVKYLFLLYSK